MLGHKTASITIGHYLHLYTEDLESLADRMDRVYRRATEVGLDQVWTRPVA